MQRPEITKLPFANRPSRSSSMSSDIAPSISSAFQTVTPSVEPPPAYVAIAAASQLVTDAHYYALQIREDPPKDPSPQGNALFSEGALYQVNAFMDHLLYKFLSTSRSSSLKNLRQAVETILKGRLARLAIASADAELAELLADGEGDEAEEENGSSDEGAQWDVDLHFRRTRLRIMVYMRLGEMEDEDEDDYLAEFGDHAHDGNEDGEDAHERGLVSWAGVIFLTSILELVAEECLKVAGQAAFKRVLSRRADQSAGVEPLSGQPKHRVMIVESDVDKAGIDSRLGRLWRSWKHKLRSPFHEHSRTLSTPRTPRTPRNASISTVQSDVFPSPPPPMPCAVAEKEISTAQSVAATENTEPTDEHPAAVEVAEIDDEDRKHYERMTRISKRPVSLYHTWDSEVYRSDAAAASEHQIRMTRQRPQTLPSPGTEEHELAKAIGLAFRSNGTSVLMHAPGAHTSGEESQVADDVPTSVVEAPSQPEDTQTEPVNASVKDVEPMAEPTDEHEAAPIDLTTSSQEELPTIDNVQGQEPIAPVLAESQTPSHPKISHVYDESSNRPSVDRSLEPSAPATHPLIGEAIGPSSASTSLEDDPSRPAIMAVPNRRAREVENPPTTYTQPIKPFKQPDWKTSSPKVATQPHIINTTFTSTSRHVKAPSVKEATQPHRIDTGFITAPTTPASSSSSAPVNSPFVPAFAKYSAPNGQRTPGNETPPDVSNGERSWFRRVPEASTKHSKTPSSKSSQSPSLKNSRTPSLKTLRKPSADELDLKPFSPDELAGRHFSSYIATKETLKYTLTPGQLQDIEVGRTLTPVSFDGIQRAESPGRGSDAGTSVYDEGDNVTYGTAKVVTPIRSYAQTPFTGPLSDTPTMSSITSSNRLGLSTVRPTESNTKPSKKGFVPREARVVTDSTKDFADFMRMTGPSASGRNARPDTAVRSIPRIQLSRRTSMELGQRPTQQPITSSALSSNDNLAPLPDIQKKTSSKLPMHTQDAYHRSPNGELIEFLRNGPPGAQTTRNGSGPASVNVNKSNGTRASDGSHNLRASSLSQQGSAHDPANSNLPLRKASFTARPELYNSSAGRRTNGTATQLEAPSDGKTRYRNKDPLALPSDDEDDDYGIVPTQKLDTSSERRTANPVKAHAPVKASTRGESLVEFLRSVEPPRMNQHENISELTVGSSKSYADHRGSINGEKRSGLKFWRNL